MKTSDTKTDSAVERIGALRIRCSSAHGLVEFSDVVATEFDARIEFRYTPAIAARAWGHPDDYDDGAPAEVTIKAIKADAAVHFDGDGVSLTAARGTDLLPLFSHYEITALEDRLIARAEAGSIE